MRKLILIAALSLSPLLAAAQSLSTPSTPPGDASLEKLLCVTLAEPAAY
ncbi:MAG: hypothetical protein JO006_04265 [Paucibacter sp.]|nr:hypothetical protein [Roseateles sp.]